MNWNKWQKITLIGVVIYSFILLVCFGSIGLSKGNFKGMNIFILISLIILVIGMGAFVLFGFIKDVEFEQNKNKENKQKELEAFARYKNTSNEKK